MSDFDAIVCGSGITGGWAAKELTERGLKVLMVERGPPLEHRKDYKTEFTPPWQLPYRGFGDPQALATTKRIQRSGRVDEWNKDMYVDDTVDIYESPPESNFQWIRAYHLGGRSLVWGRHSYRMGEHNFAANAKDGHGTAWPVSYADIAPWYDHVERFIGVNGSVDGVASLPDGQYQPSMGFNAGEQRLADALKQQYADRRLIPGRTANLTQPIGDRGICQNRDQCARGCSFGAYFSTQSSTLPAAQATGRLTVLTDSIVESIEYDAKARRASGVRLVDARTGARSIQRSRIVFLCTGSINTVSLLLRSRRGGHPKGPGQLQRIARPLHHGPYLRRSGIRLRPRHRRPDVPRPQAEWHRDSALRQHGQAGDGLSARLFLPGHGPPRELDGGFSRPGNRRGFQAQPAPARHLEARAGNLRRVPAAQGQCAWPSISHVATDMDCR